MSEDKQLEERLRRLSWPVDRSTGWAGIEARAQKEDRAPVGDRPPAARFDEQADDPVLAAQSKASFGRASVPRRGSSLRRVVYVAIAAAVVAMVSVGIVEAITHLGGQQTISVFTDDTAATTQTVTTTEAAASSTTGGPASWANGAILTLVMDPTDPSVLYAGTPTGLFKSTDEAANWAQLPTVPGGAWIVAVDPASPATVYVDSVSPGLPAHKLMRSDDGGATWTDLTTADTPRGDGFLYGIWFDTTSNPSTVYMWGRNATAWQSTDRGATWRSWAPDDALTHLAPESSAVQEARDTFVSATWGQALTDADTGAVIHVNEAPTPLSNVLIDPEHSSTIYVAAQEGVYKSIDGGGTWKRASNGLSWK